MSRSRPTLTLELDPVRLAWLSERHETGDAVAALLELLDSTMRQEILKRARRDEEDIHVLIRRRARQFERRAREDPREGETLKDVLRAAQDDVLHMCASSHDASVRAAALRLQLAFRLERGQIAQEEVAAARARLQRLREQRPGAWRRSTLPEQQPS